MSTNLIKIGAAMMALTGSFIATSANAAPVLCQQVANNHMFIDSTYVSSCVAAGVGNINGNPATDAFLLGGGTGTGLGNGAFTQSGNSGTFSINASLWNNWNTLLLGFKFGTGNQPDEWFIYELNPGITTGNWSFVNVHGRGGGLSHTNVYGVQRTTRVPEPATLSIFGLFLLGFGLMQRRARAKI